MNRLAGAIIFLSLAYAFAAHEHKASQPRASETVAYCMTPWGFAQPCRDVQKRGAA